MDTSVTCANVSLNSRGKRPFWLEAMASFGVFTKVRASLTAVTAFVLQQGLGCQLYSNKSNIH